VPNGLHGSLAHVNLHTRIRSVRSSVRVQQRRALQHDLPVHEDPAFAGRLVDLAQFDVRLGDRNTGPDVEPSSRLCAEHLCREVTPRVEGDDFASVEPGRIRRDVYRRLCLRVIWFMCGDKSAHCHSEGPVDRIGARVGANGITLLDGRGETRRNYRTPFGRVRRAPFEGNWFNAVLVGVCYDARLAVTMSIYVKSETGEGMEDAKQAPRIHRAP
jgi:hypothetical protein